VAREAGCGRATIYRAFPGGKQGVLLATFHHELQSGVAAIDAAARDLDTLEDVLVAGASTAARLIRGNAAVSYLIANEAIEFDRMGRVFEAAAACAAPHLARFLPLEDVPRAADWVSRVVLTYTFNPAPETDLRVEADARRFVRSFLLPALNPPIPATARS
jgi:AcrR family transcriptional regulator